MLLLEFKSSRTKAPIWLLLVAFISNCSLPAARWLTCSESGLRARRLLLGLIFPTCWFIGAFAPLCLKKNDRRYCACMYFGDQVACLQTTAVLQHAIEKLLNP